MKNYTDLTKCEEVQCCHDQIDALVGKDEMKNVIILIKNPDGDNVYADYSTPGIVELSCEGQKFTLTKEEDENLSEEEWDALCRKNFEYYQPYALAIKGDILKINKTGRAQIIAFKEHDATKFDGFYYMNGNEGNFKPCHGWDAEYFEEEWDMDEDEAQEFEDVKF